jgi:nitroreductase
MNVNVEELSQIGTYDEGMSWNPVEQVILSRRSVRSFKQEPLPDSMIRRILEAGRFAPSAGNCQPWRFIVVKNRAMVAEMERDAVKIIKFFMFFLDYTRGNFLRKIYASIYSNVMTRLLPHELHPTPFALMSQIAQGKAPVFHNAPTLLLLAEDSRGVSSPPMDVGICGQNMVIAAHSMGAGTCWIGLIKVLMYLPKWRKRFGIKFPYKLNVCIALGWPKPKADNPVSREVQLVQWFDEDERKPRIEEQGK